MRRQIEFRGLALAILWVGLGVLRLQGKVDADILWQALIFSVLTVCGCLLERLFNYRGDAYILSIVQAILAIGLVFLTRIQPEAALRQFWWANLGLLVFYGILFAIKYYRGLVRFQYLWGLAALALLGATLFFGVSRGGATSWLKISGLTFQTEELVKVALLLFLASYLADNEKILKIGTVQLGPLSVPGFRTLGPFLLIVAFTLGILAAQKSLGTALVFYSLFVLILYVATERFLYIGLAIPLFGLVGVAGYFLFGHVRQRVQIWLDPWAEPTGQIAQSLFAISGGKVFGVGLGNGIGAFQVPAAHTDFIFAVIAEELGFAGGMAVLCLFLMVVMRAFVVSVRAFDRFGQLLSAGIGILIGVETLIILAGVTKLLPLTGLPLPWVSYGGSSLLIHFTLLGILANISHETAASTYRLSKRREYAV